MKLRAGLVALTCLAFLGTTLIPTAQAINSSEQNTNCSATVKKNALAAIKGQTQALAKKDFKSARSFSAASFRAQVSLADFSNIITQGYAFLAKATAVELIQCEFVDKSVQLNVRIMDKNKTTYFLIYLLDPQSKKDLLPPNKTGFGVVAAQLLTSSQSGA